MKCTWSAMALMMLAQPLEPTLSSGPDVDTVFESEVLDPKVPGLNTREVQTITIDPCPPLEKPCC